jgi:hypothetical protein
MCVAYVTQALDKGTIGSASIMGWQADVGAVGQDYALTSTMLYVGIIVGEPIVSLNFSSRAMAPDLHNKVNQCIRRLPVAKILGVSMVIWTAVRALPTRSRLSRLCNAVAIRYNVLPPDCPGAGPPYPPGILRVVLQPMPCGQ